MKRTVKLCAAAACAAIAIGMAGCDLGTSGFGTVRGPDAPPMSEPQDPDLMLPPEYFDDADANWSDPWLWTVTQAGTATIVGYRGPGGHIVIPERLRLGDDCGDEYCEDEDCEEGYYTVTAITRPRQAASWWHDPLGEIESQLVDPRTFVRPPVFPNRALTSVVIPETIIVIGPGAFAETNITSVHIPDSVTVIGVSAFRDSNLASVHIPNSVTEIPENAFINTHLTHVTIPGSVRTLRHGSFANNSRLTSVDIQDGVVEILDAFWQSQITGHLALPDSVRVVGGNAFLRNRITSVRIPYGVTTIGNGAFSDNQITGHLELPDSITSIGFMAFHRNRIASFTWPRSVNTINFQTFSWNELVSVTIPGHVTVIGAGAFVRNHPLREVTIPASVTHIGSSAFGHPAGFGINAIDYEGRNRLLERVTFHGSIPRDNIRSDPSGMNPGMIPSTRCAFPGNLHAAMGAVASGTFIRTGEGSWGRP